MNENLANCRRSTLKIWQVVKFLTENLTRCFFLNSKYDALYFFKIKNRRVVFFHFKICHQKKNSIQNHSFWKSTKMENMSFSRSKKTKTWFFWIHMFFKIWPVEKFLIQNLTRCENFISKSDKFQSVFPEIWFSYCFSGSDWKMISSVNVITNLFLGRELKDNACYRVSRQMDNWKLPHVNSSLNVWGIALWQHTIFTEVTDRTLWSIKYGRSAVFLRKHPCENKRKRSLGRIPSSFSKNFVWATRRRAIERSWHLHSIYPILAAGRYLPQFWHLSKLTMPNRKSNFKTCVAQNIP